MHGAPTLRAERYHLWHMMRLCMTCALLAAAPMWGAGFDIREDDAALTVSAAGYEAVIARDGFGLTLRRQGETVLESDAPLEYMHLGKKERVAALESATHDDQAIYLMYRTSERETVARFELRPGADHIEMTEWLLNSDSSIAPAAQFRLASSGLWYGGGFQGFRDPQIIPLNDAHLDKAAFLRDGNTQGTPVWYSTKGAGVWVRTRHDFAYSFNRLVDGKGDGLLRVEMPGASSLRLDLLVAANIHDAVRRIIDTVGYPRSTPPADYFKLPIYTTWVEHKTAVSQAKVLEFAHAIRSNKLPAGVIEIDDKWESHYGDTRFDTAKFPDPKAMNDELHKLGFRVTLWMHPFVNLDSETFHSATFRPLLLADRNGEPGLIRWWNGPAAVWDFTNPKAAAELRARLDALRTEYGFDGFKFDGADVNLVPRDARGFAPLDPSEYCDIYNTETAAHYEWEETRVGVYSQRLGIVQRLIDKQSVWGKENGLAATVPEAITMSMRGFPYVMPDMVGGNQYDGDHITKDLLIRWAQASALMPLLQYSVGPWRFDDDTVRMVREASELHVRFAPYIVSLAEEAPKTGEPILRPLWYNTPEDRETLAITDEFMLGNDVVVAPVMTEGAAARDLYLPAGRWKNWKTGEVIDGARWLRNFPAPLDTLPVFVREGSKAGA